MKYKAILLLILSSILIIPSIVPNPSMEIILSWQLDKEKRDLFKKLKVKTEIEIVKKFFDVDSTQNRAYTHKNSYDKNGNKLRREFYTDSVMSKLYNEEDYITDEEGNVIEAFRKGKLIGSQEFDSEGRIVELINFDKEGNEKWTYEYEYDDEGNLTFELQYLYEEPFDTIEFNDYEYILINEKKFLKSKVSLLPLSEILWESKVFYDYDSLGRETFFQEYGPKGKILQEKYRDYTSLTGYRKFYGLDGILEFIDSMKLNSDGKPIVIMTFENGNLTKRRYRKYNEQAMLISDLELSANGNRLSEWHYNNSGEEIEYKRYENEVVNYFRISKYLVNGLQLNTITVNSKKGEKETHEFSYEYYD